MGFPREWGGARRQAEAWVQAGLWPCSPARVPHQPQGLKWGWRCHLVGKHDQRPSLLCAEGLRHHPFKGYQVGTDQPTHLLTRFSCCKSTQMLYEAWGPGSGPAKPKGPRPSARARTPTRVLSGGPGWGHPSLRPSDESAQRLEASSDLLKT